MTELARYLYKSHREFTGEVALWDEVFLEGILDTRILHYLAYKPE